MVNNKPLNSSKKRINYVRTLLAYAIDYNYLFRLQTNKYYFGIFIHTN